MKKAMAILLCAALCLGILGGCGGSSPASSGAVPEEALSSAAVPAQQEEPSVPEAPENETEPAAESAETSADSADSAEEAAASAEEYVPLESSITYPLEGNPEFSIAINPNGLIAMVMRDDGFEASASYEAMEEATGVKLDWTLYAEATWNEQFNLMIASGDWPDLFDCGVTSRYATGVQGLLDDDVVVELSGYLEEYAPDYLNLLNSNTGFRECIVQQDGAVVEFATASTNLQDKGLMIRQDWMDELDLDAPATIDELTDVLLAFKDAYDLTMPLMVCSGLDTGLTYAYNIDSRGMSNSGLGWVVEDGVVKCTYDTQGFRDYLALLNDYYQKGIFNDDFVNVSYELNTVDSTYLSGACGVFFAGAAALSESQKQNASDPNFQVTALPDIKVHADDPKSGVTEVSYTGINSISISTKCADPETAMMFCNYFYTEEGQMMANWGVEGLTYEIGSDGAPHYTEMVTSDPECFMYMLTQTKYTLQWAPTIFDPAITISAFDDVQRAAVEMWTDCRDSYMLIPKNASKTPEEQAIESQYGSDVSTYLWEHIFKIVTNQETVESYEDVIETANNMGLDELTACAQASYDRYMETHPNA